MQSYSLHYADDPTIEDIKSFHQEISMMRSAGQHPNIVSLIGYCTLYNKPLLVVEYCSKGDLQTYLRTVSCPKSHYKIGRRISFVQSNK